MLCVFSVNFEHIPDFTHYNELLCVYVVFGHNFEQILASGTCSKWRRKATERNFIEPLMTIVSIR